jgi:hypothetical protein
MAADLSWEAYRDAVSLGVNDAPRSTLVAH